uniref:N-acetyltransferase domain-containing protein n=1 Tax=Glossina brevipalpis TaxID=37001 RepID=A0A1A9WS80_9MUSC
METPKNARHQIRNMRIHTPRLSERKKKLFVTQNINSSNEENDDEGELLNGIKPFMADDKSNNKEIPKNCRSIEALIKSNRESKKQIISFFGNDLEDAEEMQQTSSSRKSSRLCKKEVSSPEISPSLIHKENIPMKEALQLHQIFSVSMRLTPRRRTKEKEIIMGGGTTDNNFHVETTNTTEEETKNGKPFLKRHIEEMSPNDLIPKCKQTKECSLVEGLSISTKSFYSTKKTSSPCKLEKRNISHNICHDNLLPKSKHIRRNFGTPSRFLINRGVHHKIRKPSRPINTDARRRHPFDIDHLLVNIRNEKLRKLIAEKRIEKQQIEKVHNILRQATNPIAMARPLSVLSSNDDTNNNEIIPRNKRQSLNQSKVSVDFSDTEKSEDECDESTQVVLSNNEEIQKNAIQMKLHQTNMNSDLMPNKGKRKFFKSGRAHLPKHVQITDNIKASVEPDGKLIIVEDGKKKIRKKKHTTTGLLKDKYEFCDEQQQATIEAILRNLDDSTYGDEIILPESSNAIAAHTHTDVNSVPIIEDYDQQIALIHQNDSNEVYKLQSYDFAEFRNRLPFNTNDPEIIERQHLLLDFLITNNICNEENFLIFIADPDNHKEEAERIVDELVTIVNEQQIEEFRQRIPYNTSDPLVAEQQQRFLEFLIANNICTEDNFDIFIRNYDNRKPEADNILAEHMQKTNTLKENTQEIENISSNGPEMENLNNSPPLMNNHREIISEESETSPVLLGNNLPTDQKLYSVFYKPNWIKLLQMPTTIRYKQQHRTLNAGFGLDQYQIDAGQKQFGVNQCQKCGLLYTVHEPEEEKLHREFHASLHVLRFKGWIDEDTVAFFPEWSSDGRILRLTEMSPPKRKERLMDVLKMVDKELGFSACIPKIFIAYLAIRKMQIVGLCLVQPLTKANKYIEENNIDYCTEEEFEVKCGISRIWVSPLHRRLHIASKLLRAVQINTIFGETISMDKIAFSAPTVMGKLFIQKVTKMENFLVYQGEVS